MRSQVSLVRERSGSVIQQIFGFLQVGGTVEDHHQDAFVRRQNGSILPAHDLSGLKGLKKLTSSLLILAFGALGL